MQSSALFMQIDKNPIQSTALHQFILIKNVIFSAWFDSCWPSREVEHLWKSANEYLISGLQDQWTLKKTHFVIQLS